MRNVFVFSFVLLTSLTAEHLDTLLNAYENQNDLSVKTKKESAGNVIVYTSQDLRRMQVHSLEELLKSIPYYRYNKNSLGFTDVAYNGYIVSTANQARLYINEREISTPYFGNAISLMSQLDFEYIDHVEVYYGVTTFEFGIEPAKMVVKVYTKDPSRENGGQVKLSVGSRGTKEGSVAISEIFDDFSMYAYLGYKDLKDKKVTIQDTPLRKDKESTHLFLSLQNENHRVEYNALSAHSDTFMHGENVDYIKNDGNANAHMLGYYFDWLDDKLSISLNYIHLGTQADKKGVEPVAIKHIQNRPIYITDMHTKNEESTMSAMVKYREKLYFHNLLFGLYVQDKKFNSKELKLNGVNVSPKDFKMFYEKERIYGFFVEDNYELANNQMLVASFKYDTIDIDRKDYKKKDQLFYRLGYIYTQEDFSFKTFYTRYNLGFEPFVYSYSSNPKDIKNQTSQNLFLEFDLTDGSFDYNINMFYSKDKNVITSEYKNSNDNYTQKGASLSVVYDFDLLNKLQTNVFVVRCDADGFNMKDVHYGANIRLLNTIGKFDIYNELIYRGGYEGLKDGYDFNFAITYRHNKDLSFFVKGENVFGKAIKTSYNHYSYSDKGVIQTKPVEVSPQRFMVGMEYRF